MVSMMGAEYVSPIEQMYRSIDREMIEELRTYCLTKKELGFIGFFCAIGTAASAVLEDMAHEGRTWPGCEPFEEPRKKPKSKRSKLKRRRSRR